jgi:hypothetical protein
LFYSAGILEERTSELRLWGSNPTSSISYYERATVIEDIDGHLISLPKIKSKGEEASALSAFLVQISSIILKHSITFREISE